VARWTWRFVNNVALVVPGQGIDTSSKNPAAQLQLNVLAAVAEFERSIIVERVNSGLAAARAKGVRLGRPPTLIPYEVKGTHGPRHREGVGNSILVSIQVDQ
jgi:DNA invertase Pin-like site-specific DNA recombinase